MVIGRRTRRLAGGSPEQRQEAEERCSAIDVVSDYLREHYRDGSCSVRVVFSDVPDFVWEEIEGERVRRFPAGDVKVETLAIGLAVEWERRAPEARETQTIPLEERRT